MKIYEVGGCVRDTLMNKEPKDIDYVIIDGNHEELIALGYEEVGADFPVYLHPITKDEHALARVERKTGKGYNGFKTETKVNGKFVTLEEDLIRRDLTINAIAYDRENDEYIDPYNGREDLKNKILRPVSDSFIEDPLRFLRLARFASRYPDFKVDYDALKKLLDDKPDIKQEIRDLTLERVFIELEKVLGEDKPSTFFRVLKELNLLKLNFPYINDMVGKDQRTKHHAEGDVFEHTMRTLDETCKLTKNTVSRFAVLIHDLGKPVTYEYMEKKDISEEQFLKEKYYGHDNVDILKDWFEWFEKNKYPKKYINFGRKAIKYHHTFHKIEAMNPKKITKLFLNKKEFFDNPRDIQEMIYVAKGDAYGRIISNSNDSDVLTFEENEQIFKEGTFKKDNGMMYKKAELIKNVNYNIFLDIFELLKTVNAKEISKTDKYKHENGKVNAEKIKTYLYDEKLKIVKKYIKQHQDKTNDFYVEVEEFSF